MTSTDLIPLAEHIAVPAAVRLMREAATKFVSEAGADALTVENAKLVVSEAATNVVLHAYPDAEPGNVELFGQVDRHTILLVLEDRGRGLNARSLHPGLGMGLKIIASSTAHSRVAPRTGGGTVVHMRFETASEADR